MGLKTALVQDRFVVGGNNSSEVRVWLGGEVGFEPYPNIGSIVKELEQSEMHHYGSRNTADIYEDDKKMALLEKEKNITLFLGHAITDAVVDGGLITGAVICDVKDGAKKIVKAPLFVDATGDSALDLRLAPTSR